jgi:hypothetical protein
VGAAVVTAPWTKSPFCPEVVEACATPVTPILLVPVGTGEFGESATTNELSPATEAVEAALTLATFAVVVGSLITMGVAPSSLVIGRSLIGILLLQINSSFS